MFCFVRENSIYDRGGNEIQPDGNGIVVLQVDDRPRRFVKEKLIDWLKRNNKIVPPPKVKKPPPPKEKKPPVQKIKKERPKKYVIHKVRKVRTDFTRKGFKIKVTKDGVVQGTFLSINKCSDAIKVSKGHISKILRGKRKNETGFQFKKL